MFSHQILAAVFRTPELELDQENADMLAGALQKVNRHYNVKLRAKTLDWYNLCVAAVCIYGPKFSAAGARRGQEREAKKKAKENARFATPPDSAASVIHPHGVANGRTGFEQF